MVLVCLSPGPEFLKKGLCAKEDGEYSHPSTGPTALMANALVTDKMAESCFGIFDNLLGRLTNASQTTLAAMVAGSRSRRCAPYCRNQPSSGRATWPSKKRE